MALFDAFTGAPQIQAAQKQQAYVNATQQGVNQNISGAMGQGLGAITSGVQQGTGAIGTGIDQARSDIMAFHDPALEALQRGQDRGVGALYGAQDQGIAALTSGAGQAAGAYDPLVAAGNQYGLYGNTAANMYQNALGLMGPEGNAAATAAFQAGPGYDFMMNQGLESIVRNANAAGGALGGNQFQAAQVYGSGLANQEYQNWLKNTFAQSQLYSPLELQAKTAAAQGLGGIYQNQGTNLANLYSGTGGRVADIYGKTGQSLADFMGNEGRSLADLASKGGLAEGGIYAQGGQSQADLIRALTGQQTDFTGQSMKTYSQALADEGNASANANKNLWGALLAGGQLAAGIPGLGGAVKSAGTGLYDLASGGFMGSGAFNRG